ncbi:unnamed protein product [Notodromas monacha]|uniref:Ferric-chelate reductase 1 n=1 Tax=Notodromas monacha TaxID=399045 RepID=A0A7R9GHH6_9CRUS|nr:unnamed protein product [Notodromas monacha]CAG0921481.1 unnamed protein product [Notodromas monacha]
MFYRATFVKNKDTYWTGVESPKIVVKRSVSVEPLDSAAVAPKKEPGRNPNVGFPPGVGPASTQSNAQSEKRRPAVSGLSDLNDTAIYDGCGLSKGCFGSPEGCTEKRKCDKVVTYSTTSDGEAYRFELQGGVAELQNGDAYIAVGFSDDGDMGDDAVVACFTHDDIVKPMRAYNLPNQKTNRMATEEQQRGITNFFGSVRDTTISCSFDLEPEFTLSHGNYSSVYNLGAKRYHLLLATGNQKSPTQVGYHTSGTARTKDTTALSSTLIQAADSMLFIRLHGAFMFGAWIGTASMGILFARYFKTTWSNSSCMKKDLWFRFHQTFMVTTWSLTMAAFVLIFLEIGGWTSVKISRNPHAVLGCVTTGLCFLQPIGALFRPHPDSKRRPIFNWLHWFGGNSAQIIGSKGYL